MRLNLLSRETRHGLTRDVELLRDVFEGAGHSCAFVEWPRRAEPADVNVHVELLSIANMGAARWNVAIPNPERMRPAWLKLLRDFDAVWSKCVHTDTIVQSLGAPSTLTGFVARDLRDRSVRKARFALHVRGGSPTRGTDRVLEAWSAFGRDLPELVIVSADPIKAPSPHVRVFAGRCSEMHLRWLMNAARFYVCPSSAEGWGHTIPEALSTGAVVVTTDASPMREHVRSDFAALLPAARNDSGPFVKHDVAATEIASQVLRFAAMSDSKLDYLGDEARAFTLERTRAGRRAILDALEEMIG